MDIYIFVKHRNTYCVISYMIDICGTYTEVNKVLSFSKWPINCVLFCCVVLCCVVLLCYVMLCIVLFCSVMSCHVMSCHVV